ncbi:hypothetical protein TNCV_2899981 [Trichonephila clavipes]|nr:hypothetical protein TNCV_2899981 [Trichonephila clavipes]
MPVPSHPLKPFSLATGLTRLYDARSFNIKPFSESSKAVLNDAHPYIHHICQETWDQQVINKLHSLHPSTAHWAAVPVRRQDVLLTRLRIGLTHLTHGHLLLRESPPVCDLSM